MYPEPFSRAQAARVHALKQRKNRMEQRRFLAEGIRLVEDLVSSGIVLELALVSPSLEDTERGRTLAATLAARTRVHRVGEGDLRALADTETPQGVLVVAHMPEGGLSAAGSGRGVVLALDAVQDPGNFGTLVRSADAFGAAAVVTLPGTVDAWNPKSVRASAGASFRVPIVPLAVAELAAWAGARGYEIWGAAARGESVAALAPPERVVLVIGNEGAGLSRELEPHLSRTVAVPIRGRVESLNAAMAGTVLLYLLALGSDAHA